MTRPANDSALAPARRGRTRFSQDDTPVTSQFEDAEVARGQAAAVLGALARMQLRLDVVAREQTDKFAAVMALLAEINNKLDYAEGPPEAGPAE